MKSLSLSKPHMIIMVGIPGSGKTFFAEKFAETFRAPYVSREKLFTHLGASDAKIADAILFDQVTELLKTQQSIILEGPSTTRSDRSELTKKARAAGYETLLIWVQTDPVTAKNRSLKETKQTVSSLTAEEHDRQTKRFTAPSKLEKPVVISGQHTYASQAKVVLKKLSAPRAAISTHVTAPIRNAHPKRTITIR